MTDLRDRLRAADPALAARPLDPDELAVMRRAMQAPRPSPRRPWVLAAGVAVVATCILAAVLLWPEAPPAQPIRPSVVTVEAPAPPAPVPARPEVAEARPPRRRAVRPPVPAPVEPTQVKEIRFVTASGTQILWTFRSSEEGA